MPRFPRPYALNANVFHGIAHAAYERLVETPPSDTKDGQWDALIAILFSAAALESLINEVALIAASRPSAAKRVPFLRALGDVLVEAEKTRGSVRQKYLLTKHILPGKPYDRGSQPYQDFDLLFKIRDEVVHPKPEQYDNDPERITKPLETKKLIEPVTNVQITWMTRISTRAVALWACNVVADMAASLCQCLVENRKVPRDLSHLVLALSRFKTIATTTESSESQT